MSDTADSPNHQIPIPVGQVWIDLRRKFAKSTITNPSRQRVWASAPNLGRHYLDWLTGCHPQARLGLFNRSTFQKEDSAPPE